MKIIQTILNAFVNINNVSTDFFYFLIPKINFVLMRQYDLLVFFVVFFQPLDSVVVKFNQPLFSTILACRMAFVPALGLGRGFYIFLALEEEEKYPLNVLFSLKQDLKMMKPLQFQTKIEYVMKRWMKLVIIHLYL